MSDPIAAALPTTVLDRARAEISLAGEIAELVGTDLEGGRSTVLGFATGRTPVGVYDELVRLHREGGLDLSRVVAFNLDEYVGLAPDDPRRFRAFMRRHLWDRVNTPLESVHMPDVDAPLAELPARCARYEGRIREAGGISLQILGIGRSGHIGFNEPGSGRDSRTRLVELDDITRADNAAAFGSPEAVPARAVTMGVGTILEARRIRVLAFGPEKAEVVQRALYEEVGAQCPVTFLRRHPDATLRIDAAAAGEG